MRCARCTSRSAPGRDSRSRTRSRWGGGSARGGGGDAGAAAAGPWGGGPRPVVEKLFAAANRSSYWYETFAERMRRCDARGLAYDYMTRSGRMSEARLREI